MPLFALDPWWSDFYTVGGFVAGVLGTLVGVGGFWIAIWQIRATKQVAEAAREAASKTLTESKKSYARFVGSFASRLMSELQRAVNDSAGGLAGIRAHDLAELLGTLQQQGASLPETVVRLREFGQVFAERAVRAANQGPRFDRERWRELLSELHTLLDPLRAPFEDDHNE